MRIIPSSGEKVPAIGLGSWLTFAIDIDDEEELERVGGHLEEVQQVGNGHVNAAKEREQPGAQRKCTDEGVSGWLEHLVGIVAKYFVGFRDTFPFFLGLAAGDGYIDPGDQACGQWNSPVIQRK